MLPDEQYRDMERIPDDYFGLAIPPDERPRSGWLIVAAFVVGFLLWAGVVAWFVWAVS